MPFNSAGQGHHWRFTRLGGFDQVIIDSADDLRHLDDLDQKLWAALSCPTTDVEFDRHTLALLDADGDGRIRVPEVLAAVAWVCGVLRDPAEMFAKSSALPLASIDDSTEEGRRLLASARRILMNLGRPEDGEITVAETRDTKRIFAGTRFNGDGVVPPGSAGDENLALAISDIIGCVGSRPDRSGEPGLDGELLDRFVSEAHQCLAWWAEAEADPARLLPLGDATESAADLFAAVKPKIDDYFTRTRLIAFDTRAEGLLNPGEADYAALALRTLSPEMEELAVFPVARAQADQSLSLDRHLNPHWAPALEAFRTQVLVPLLGELSELTAGQWRDVSERFAAHSQWRARQAGSMVEGLGAERVQALLDDQVQQGLRELIAQDLAVAGEADSIAAVDRLVHYYQHLDTLLHNFVSLRDFYTPDRMAIFQAGRLYLDGRSCNLCVVVGDIAAHSTLATLSQACLVYCACRRRGGEEKMTIAAALTGGDSDNLMVGRNGVFYDRAGNDWDATVVKLIEHPISVSQAFWLPYKRIGAMISQQIEKFASAQDKAVEDNAARGIGDLSTQAQSGKATSAPFDIGKFAGIFAAIGLAVGAIGTALAAALTGLLSLSPWEIPLAVAGLLLLVSGPSMLIAYLKLRRRNLAPILDANGWAVNTQARINLPFGASLTGTAHLPPGARRSLRDPFAEKRPPWRFYLFLVVLFALIGGLWQQGYIGQWWETLRGEAEQSEVAPVGGEASGDAQ
jgi:hypothetical protein